MKATILVGDVRTRLAELEAGSVQTCITSPPYWGLRDYGHDGQIGLEQTPDAYVAEMVAVFREVRRVLADDGTCWVNLGDSYATGAGRNDTDPANIARRSAKYGTGTGDGQGPREFKSMQHPTKPKDLVGIPWRVAFALQADGWWLRQDIIWAKPNPMPESVTDRCTKAHEYLFLLTKSARYYYDAGAVSEPLSDVSLAQIAQFKRGDVQFDERRAKADVPGRQQGDRALSAKGGGSRGSAMDEERGRNRRSVWTIATKPYSGAHFAVMPEALVEPCVLAGSRPGDLVVDPFAGSGTVGVVALKHGRDFVGVELNPEYAALAEARIHDDGPLFNEVVVA